MSKAFLDVNQINYVLQFVYRGSYLLYIFLLSFVSTERGTTLSTSTFFYLVLNPPPPYGT